MHVDHWPQDAPISIHIWGVWSGGREGGGAQCTTFSFFSLCCNIVELPMRSGNEHKETYLIVTVC